MSHYITIDDVKPLIPNGWLVESLDDDADGTQEMFDAVRDAAEGGVNGMLATQFTVPVPSPENYPFLNHVTALEAARICYNRRGYEEKGFPHHESWLLAWKRLDQIGKGELQLGPTTQGATLARPRGSVITGPARTHSTSGAFTA